jgi:aryl-alcohol dehydrogenase-like predicted oxidoreductase
MRVGMLGLGAMEIAYPEVTLRTVDSLIGVALDRGINVIDTAAMYGRSEEKLGRTLGPRRAQFLLFTKCGRHAPPAHGPMGLRMRVGRKLRLWMGDPEAWDVCYWHPRVLQWNIEQSLRRLKTDWLDLLQLHSCSEEILRRGDVIEVLHRARSAGKTRYLGYSGDGPAALYAVQCGQFDAVQLSLNVADQQALDRVLPAARDAQMGVIAKRPIANVVWRMPLRPEFSRNRVYWERLRQLRYGFLQTSEGMRNALRFTLSVVGVHTAILGTSKPAHLSEAVDWISTGVFDQQQFDSIRDRWRSVAEPDWVGQS